MLPWRMGRFPGKRVADVAAPQTAGDSSLDCLFGNFSAMLHAGRTQATYLVKRWLYRALPATVQEYWSRGCPRAHVSYLAFACWRLSPPAQRKKKPSPMWTNRLAPSQPTQANTSDLIGRAAMGNLGRHAVFCGAQQGFGPCAPVRRVMMPDASKTSKTMAFFQRGGLSAPFDLVLKTVAVPYTQDRSLC